VSGVHALAAHVGGAGEAIREHHGVLMLPRDTQQPETLGGELDEGDHGHAQDDHGHQHLEQREASVSALAHRSARRVATRPVSGFTVMR
jgi:hypothetical protein